MRREYCTYLNLHYLGRALALHESLAEHEPDFHLRAVCFDEVSYRVLEARDLPGLEPVHIAEVEAADPELAATRGKRSALEYLWTSTPCILRYLIGRDALRELTYVDADVCLFSSPEPFFEELGSGSVLLTPAASTPHHYSRHLARKTGLYVVQFLTIRADEDGSEALEWWRERCLEWCFERPEEGRFGDQKYLDDWTERFAGVRNLGHPGMLGPWSIEARDVVCGPEAITVDGEPLVAYHFMGLRLYADGTTRLAAGRFRLSSDQRRWIYGPYLSRVRHFRAQAAELDPAYRAALTQREPLRWRVQAPISTVVGAAARLRIKVAPHFNVGPYLPGGYVPRGYRGDPGAVAWATGRNNQPNARATAGIR